MREAYEYVTGGSIVDPLAALKLLELEILINERQIVPSCVNKTEWIGAFVSTTDYEAYLTAEGMPADKITEYLTGLSSPTDVQVGFSIDKDIVFCAGSDAFTRFPRLATIWDATASHDAINELRTLITPIRDNLVSEAVFSTGCYRILEGKADYFLNLFADLIGATIVPMSEGDPATDPRYCYLSIGTASDPIRRLALNAPFNVEEIVFEGICSATYDYGIKVSITADTTYAPLPTFNANFNTSTVEHSAVIAPFLSALLGSSDGVALYEALDAANLVGEAASHSAWVTAVTDQVYADRPAAEKDNLELAVIAEVGWNVALAGRPLATSSFAAGVPLAGFSYADRGVDKRVTMVGSVYHALHTTSLIKVLQAYQVDAGTTPYADQITYLQAHPGLFRSVFYVDDLAIPENIVTGLISATRYGELKAEAGETNDFFDLDLLEGVGTWQDVKVRMDKLSALPMSTWISPTIPDAIVSPIGSVAHCIEYPKGYWYEISTSVVEGAITVVSFSLKKGETTIVVDKTHFEEVMHSQNLGVPVAMATGDESTLDEVYQHLYGSLVQGEILDAMTGGFTSISDVESHNFNYGHLFPRDYPDLSLLDDDLLRRGIIVLETLPSAKFKDLIATLFFMCPHDAMFDIG